MKQSAMRSQSASLTGTSKTTGEAAGPSSSLRTSFPLTPAFAEELMARYGWSIPYVKALHKAYGLPLTVVGEGKGARYTFVFAAVDRWLTENSRAEHANPVYREHASRFTNPDQQSGARGRRRI